MAGSIWAVHLGSDGGDCERVPVNWRPNWMKLEDVQAIGGRGGAHCALARRRSGRRRPVHGEGGAAHQGRRRARVSELRS